MGMRNFEFKRRNSKIAIPITNYDLHIPHSIYIIRVISHQFIVAISSTRIRAI